MENHDATNAGLETPPQPNGMHEYEGRYYLGDGLGVNLYLSLRSDGTFAFSWDGCMGTYDERAGRWRVEGGLIHLDILEPEPDPDGRTMPTPYVPIRWGPRLYLQPEKDLPQFFQFVEQGFEPRDEIHGLVFLRDGDWELEVSGNPVTPDITDRGASR